MLKEKRVAAGLTQKELAIKANVSQSYITKVEQGKLKPSYEAMQAILGALKNDTITAKDIMTTELIKVDIKQKMNYIVEIFFKHNVSQLLVYDTSFRGILTERSMMKCLSNKQNIEQYVNTNVHMVPLSCPLSTIEVLLEQNYVLVHDKGEVVGIITPTDVLKHLKKY
jgi:predicted transcriptional regulator